MYITFTRKKKINGGEGEIMGDSIELIHISDLHYVKEGGEIRGGALIPLNHTGEILEAFCLKMKEDRPDLLLLTGDLSENGDFKSHLEIAEQLRGLKELGIKVLVIPGNHDLKKTTQEEFKSLYKDFGYIDDINVVGRDKASLSYMYALNNHINILMIDVETSKEYMNISNASYRWIEKMLKYSKEQNKIVIAASHENILAHNKFFISKYKIKNSSKLVNLFNDYNVRVNLSGHMHVQHLSRSKGVLDAAVGSISVYPNKYARMKVDIRGKMEYETREIEWKHKEESKEYFEKFSKDKVGKLIESFNLGEDEKKKLLDFIVYTNLSYFSGTMDDRYSVDSDEYKLWMEKAPKETFSLYLDSVYTDRSKNHNEFMIE